MKKLNIAATGYYGSTESWKWVASSYEMIAELLGKLIHRDDPVIITGVNVVGNNVSDGFISYAGELFFFKGGTKTDTVVIIENVTEQEYNTNPSGSGTMPTYPTYIDRYAQCGQSGEGVDEFDFDDFTRLDELISISERTKQATVNTLGVARIIHPTDVALGNDDESILTIKKLVNYRKAAENKTGIIAIATQSETNAGTDDARAVTPKKLAGMLKTHASGTADLGTWSDANYIRSENVSIPELPDNNYIVQLTLFSDDLFSVNNHDTYFAFSRQKQNNSFTITVRRTDDGGSTSGDPHIYVDWVVIKP